MRILEIVHLLLIIFLSHTLSAQPGNVTNVKGPSSKGSLKNKITFNSPTTPFIENIGQYGNFLKGYEQMGEIRFGYEGHEMPVLFTTRGIIFLQRKWSALTQRQQDSLKKQGLDEESIERKMDRTDKVITMKWTGGNTNCDIVTKDRTAYYNTYGMLQGKAYGYKKLTLKNVYPGIDVEYICCEKKAGFEYRLVAQNGVDLNVVSLQYGGDTKNLELGKKGELVIRSKIGKIITSMPVSYYNTRNSGNTYDFVNSIYSIRHKQVFFSFINGYDKKRSITIDPFVSSTSNLTGGFTNNTIAKDIDFDYQGNVYVSGGGNKDVHKLAKYDANGVLLWTFSGSIAIPVWDFGASYGGWVVEKTTGKIYLGQGFNVSSRVIRLDANGVYDNYISAADPNFRENWKMIWNCNNGNPQILIGGGTTTTNLNFTTLAPPSVTTAPVNITGNSGITQDIADMVIDPLTKDMYTIFASKSTPAMNDQMFKHAYPYSTASIVWQVPSGYTNMKESDNKPYLEWTSLLPGFNTTDNAINLFAINSGYLFYWDGKNLKAFDKATGATVGTPLVTPLAAKYQGGIYADECNNIFIGYNNGKIKVLKFNGSIFDDAAEPDINVPGFLTKSVYDLTYNNSDKLLYACGYGFVASFDISSYCISGSLYDITVTPDCVNNKAAASLTPAPPAGSVVTYSLYLGTTMITTNTTGLFTGLSNSTVYTVKAIINQNCSGISAVDTNFSYPYCAPAILLANHTTCGLNNGALTINALFGTGPHTFSLDGIIYQTSNVFSNLSSGSYTIYMKDALGEIRTMTEVVNASFPLQLVSSKIDASCGLANGSIIITAIGGGGGYQYSIDNINFQASHIFQSVPPGSYTVYAKDATNCNAAISVLVNALPTPRLKLSISANDICPGTPVTFTANSSYTGMVHSYQWRLNGTDVGQNSITYTNSNLSNGDRISCIIVADSSCSGTPPFVYSDTATIIIRPVPGITFSPPNPAILAGSSIQLNATATGNNSSYLWSPATALSSTTILNPIANPLLTTDYNLKVISTNGCSAEAKVKVRVFADIYVPNAFTPNGDHKNDIFSVLSFGPYTLGYMMIYDRGGKTIFTTSDAGSGWDGTFNGKKCVQGTYTYVIKVWSLNIEYLLYGNVILIR